MNCGPSREIGQTRWHQEVPHHLLVKHCSMLFPKSESHRTLIPLCGKTVDLKYIADRGNEVVGVECAEVAIRQIREEQLLPLGQDFHCEIIDTVQPVKLWTQHNKDRQIGVQRPVPSISVLQVQGPASFRGGDIVHTR